MFRLVSDYIGTILNVLSSIIFARLVLREKTKIEKWKLLILILLVSFCLQIFYYLNITIMKTYVAFFLFAILFKITYSLDITKTFILDFFHFCIGLLADIITFNLFSLFVGEEKIYNVLAGSMFCNIVVFIIMIFLSLAIRKLVNKVLNIKLKYQTLFFLFGSILCTIGIFYSTFKLGTNSADKLLCVICLIFIVFVWSYSFIQTYRNSQLILQYDNLLEFIKKYEVEIDNQRILRHETKNQLLTIKSKLIDKEKDVAVINYIDEIIKEDKAVNHSEYAKLKYLPSNGIRGLFYFKISSAQEKNVKVGINISKNVEKSFLADLDSYSFNQIGKVLGVYLDNAIEGAESSVEKSLGVEAFLKGETVIFVISNSYNSDVKMIGRSSKSPERGHGLILANNIIKGNSKLDSSTEITDLLYIKKLIIKK